MATHSSILAWKIQWTEEPVGLQYMGLQRVGYNGAAKEQTTTKLIKFHIDVLCFCKHYKEISLIVFFVCFFFRIKILLHLKRQKKGLMRISSLKKKKSLVLIINGREVKGCLTYEWPTGDEKQHIFKITLYLKIP